MDLIFLTNYGITVAALIVSLIGLILSLSIRYSDKRYQKYFVVIFSILIAYSASALIMWLIDDKPGYGYMLASYIFLFCESFFSSLLMPLLTMFLLYCAGRDFRRSPLFFTVLSLWFVYFVLLVITQFTDWIYYFTPDNVYHRGPYYAVLLAPPALLMIANLIALFRLSPSIPPLQRKAFFIYILIPLVCMIIQMFFYGILMTILGSTVSALIMTAMILQDQIRTSVNQERENARQKASIAVLQMRPHFIYNTMMSIYYLCEQDTAKAQQVILDFSSYLRKNFTAVAKESTIPFREELEHTRAYLAVEQARFEGQLFVEFDTPIIAFRLPPLTLQPIVENAVKYGVDPELEPLYISVHTRAVDDGVEIIVEDSGPGFEASENNNEPHVALKNIRERLSMMCNGTLTVTAHETGGTIVTVFIPQSAE